MNKIGYKELFTMCFSIIIASLPGFGTSLILNYSKNTSTIAVIVGMLIGFIPLLMILYVGKYTTHKTIFSFNKNNFKLLGNVINFFYVIGIIYIGFLISWSITNFTITQLLIRSSYYLVVIVMFIVIGIAVTKGIEVIGRSNLILTILASIILIIVFIFLTAKVDINNIYPIFNASKVDFIKACLLIPTLTVYPLISILCIKKNDIDKPNKYNKIIIISYLLAILIMIIFIFFIISIYGIDFAKMFTYPEYYLFKKVEAFEFISRIENIASFIIYIGFFGNMCMLISFVKTYFQEKFNIKKETHVNILVFILSLIVPLASVYVFKTYHTFYLIDYYPVISSIILLALIINCLLIFIKRKDLKTN